MLCKTTIKLFLVAKYLDRANLVSRMASATACCMGLVPLGSEKIAFPESKGHSIPETVHKGIFFAWTTFISEVITLVFTPYLQMQLFL